MTNVTYLPWVDPDTADNFPASPSDSAPEGVESLETFPEELEDALVRKLAYADMSVQEARQWLRDHNAAEVDAHSLIDKCERLGYLNDERLATTLTLRWSERKGKSRGAISSELRQRGISSSHIEQALAEIGDDAEQARATELALARIRQFRSLDDATAERRLTGYLSRRGYSGHIVRQAVREAMVNASPDRT